MLRSVGYNCHGSNMCTGQHCTLCMQHNLKPSLHQLQQEALEAARFATKSPVRLLAVQPWELQAPPDMQR